MATRLVHAMLAAVLAATSSAAAAPATRAPAASELTRLLHEFLEGASRNDAAIHDRFWADDLIYTGSSGRRIGKAEILKDVRESQPPLPGDDVITYTAEDVRIQQYGRAALVAFRLVATTARGDSSSVTNYLNTGFFIQRHGRWQAAGWQATRMP